MLKLRERPARAAAIGASLAGCVALAGARGGPSLQVTPTNYTEMCDASAAFPLSDQMFVVANDEDNVLRAYTVGTSTPTLTFPLNKFLGVEDEADIEGAARIGDLVYWITSHGRNKDAEEKPERLNFFAIRIGTTSGATNGQPQLKEEGKPYRNLLEELIKPALAEQGFPTDIKTAPWVKKPEAEGGLNIEGLAAAGDRLLIGFRNPIAKNKALVVELLNPSELIASQTAKARRGKTFLLDLGGRGIRSMEALPNGQGFAITAGSFDDVANFAVYRWRGDETAPVQITGLKFDDFRPEALFVDTAASPLTLSVLSDDGDVVINGLPCKNKKQPKNLKRIKLAKLTLD